MNRTRAKELGLSTLLSGEDFPILGDLLAQSYGEVPTRPTISGGSWRAGPKVAIQVEDDLPRVFTLEVNLPGTQLKYVATGVAPLSAAPGRYIFRQTNWMNRAQRASDNGVHYGSSQVELLTANYRVSYPGRDAPRGHPCRVATKDTHPHLQECLSMEVSVKTLRRMLNKVSRDNRVLFCLASSGDTWNVFSDSANDNSNRFRLTPTINSNGVAGVFYNRIYDVLFRKKEALRGVFRDYDESTLITLGVTESNALMIKLRERSDSSTRLCEYLLFESDPEALTTSELPETLPFKGAKAAPLMVTENTLEEPIEVTEEIQVEEPTHVESETPTLTEEELTRLNLWETAYIRWAETTGQSQASYSTSPTIWFSRYMMEKLRLGESIDELDNQLLSKY